MYETNINPAKYSPMLPGHLEVPLTGLLPKV